MSSGKYKYTFNWGKTFTANTLYEACSYPHLSLGASMLACAIGKQSLACVSSNVCDIAHFIYLYYASVAHTRLTNSAFIFA